MNSWRTWGIGMSIIMEVSWITASIIRPRDLIGIIYRMRNHFKMLRYPVLWNRVSRWIVFMNLWIFKVRINKIEISSKDLQILRTKQTSISRIQCTVETWTTQMPISWIIPQIATLSSESYSKILIAIMEVKV